METIWQLEAWWAYASRCARLPANAPGCDFFWNAIAIIGVVVFAFIALYIIRRMARHFLAVRAENARLAEKRRVADGDTMARYKADMDNQYVGPSEENVEARIRQALQDRKPEDWGRPGTRRKPASSD